MAVEKTETEILFSKMEEMAMEHGFTLDEVKMSRRPFDGGSLSEHRIRSKNYMGRLPHPLLFEHIIGL